jgi:hypothetical protein
VTTCWFFCSIHHLLSVVEANITPPRSEVKQKK